MGNCISASNKVDRIIQPYLPMFCETYLNFDEKHYTPAMDLLSAFFIFVREKTNDQPGIHSIVLEDLYLSLTTYLYLHYQIKVEGFRSSEIRYSGLFLPGVSLKMFPRFI